MFLKPQRNFIRRFSAAILLSAFAFSLSSLSYGQDEEAYKSDAISADYITPEVPGDATRTEKSELRAQIRAIKDKRSSDYKAAVASMEGSFNASAIKPYLEGAILPQMTFTDDNTLSKLGSLRQSFFKTYVSDAPASSRQQLVTQILLPYAQRLISENYHPASQLNAVLLLGMMNDVDPARGTMPQPNAASINYLIQLMNDANAKEFLKVGAMTGIHRNTMLDSKQDSPRIDGNARNQIGTIALAVTRESFQGQDKWDPETSYWLRRRSVQVLGHLKTADNDRVTAILGILENEAEKPWLRFDAMTALKEMELNASAADKALEAVTGYVVDSLKFEANHLQKDLTEMVAINLLYGSNDLLKSGTEKKEDEREIGSSFGIGDDQSGAADQDGGEELKPKLDLPTYRTNDARRIIQGITFKAREVLYSLDAKVSAPQETLRKDIVEIFDELLVDANVGLVNLGAEEKDTKDLSEEEKQEMITSIADRMSQLFNKSATKLESKFGGGEAAATEADIIGG